MAHQSLPQRLTLAGVAHRCAEETTRFFQHRQYDPQYCFELFRRAAVQRDERAWELIYTQYRPLVAGWVRRHPAFPESGEEVQYFVNRALEKIWSVLSPGKFSQFPNLKSLLRYLQMCVHSVILDHVRKAEPAVVGVWEETRVASSAVKPTPGERVLDLAQRESFWQEINERLQDEKERWVVYGSFVLAFKPRQLYARYPGLFRDVKEVYRVKENVLARLRRDKELEKILVGNA